MTVSNMTHHSCGVRVESLDDRQWFRDARFGIFVHWGLYAIPARGEWVMHYEGIPAAEYNRLADEFDPQQFDADAWVDLAVRAGAKYMVLTARHHDGYCLFDSQVTDFTSVKTRPRRDFVGEYVEACRRRGLKVGLYYSLMDWQFPGYFAGPQQDPAGFEALVGHVHAQMRELMSHYGTIDLLWYDGGNIPGLDGALIADYWHSAELNAMARALQPQILINDRSGLPEDFDTCEQEVVPAGSDRLWEACMTIGSKWGYVHNDPDLRTTRELLAQLVQTARFGGNFLLNVGPRADGTIQPEFVERLEAIGQWMAAHGEAIYSSERTPFTEAQHVLGPATARRNRLYFHLFNWPGTTARIVGVDGQAQAAHLLRTGQALTFDACTPGALGLCNLPPKPGDPLAEVVRVEVATPAALRRPASVLTEVDTGRHLPAETPILTAATLRTVMRTPASAELIAGEAWCPNWRETEVLTVENGTLTLDIDVPVTGRYHLELGAVCARPAMLHILLDGQPVPGMSRVSAGAYPVTLRSRELLLQQGRRRVEITPRRPLRYGVYGLRLMPVWRQLPSEYWETIGPFPTAWGMRGATELVRAAFDTQFPPETAYDPAARYAGAEGAIIGWRYARKRRGDYAHLGVNFSFRCGVRRYGVCYARTLIESPAARDTAIIVGCDWWAHAYLNGTPVTSTRDPREVAADGAAFNGWKPMPGCLPLRQGVNELLIKCHPGSVANWCTCAINDPGDLRIGPACRWED